MKPKPGRRYPTLPATSASLPAWPLVAVCVAAAILTCPGNASGQPPGDTAWIAEVEERLARVDELLKGATSAREAAEPDSARVLLSRAVWEAVWALETTEMQSLQAAEELEPEDSIAFQRLVNLREQAATNVTAVLDTVVLETQWGEEVLEDLLATYPASPVFLRYKAELAMAAGRTAQAREIYESLLLKHPRQPELHRGYAAILEAEEQADAARTALVRALELDPEHEETFRSLVRLSRDEERLESLLDRVRRLMVRRPDSRTVAEREVELLHRLDRPEEAAEAARRLRERFRER